MNDPISQALAGNRHYAVKASRVAMPEPPKCGLAIVTCMDPRIDPLRILGLEVGDAVVIRNAGGVVTDEVLRSLRVANQMLDVRSVMVIGHTDCNILGVDDVYSFADAFQAVRKRVQSQIAKVMKDHRLREACEISGHVLDIRTGWLAYANKHVANPSAGVN